MAPFVRLAIFIPAALTAHVSPALAGTGIPVQCDSSNSIVVTGKILMGTSGFAPVPAFSFNKPLVMAFFTLTKKRFSYEPDFRVGLNGQPWMINNNIRFTAIKNENIIISGAINPSLFFQTVPAGSGEDIIHAQRNLSFDISIVTRVSKLLVLTVLYLHNHACDPGALSGDYYNISISTSPVSLSKKFLLHATQESFYFNFGELNGLFTSTSLRVAHHRLPLSVFFQGVLPLWANFSGNQAKWNAGIMYSF